MWNRRDLVSLMMIPAAYRRGNRGRGSHWTSPSGSPWIKGHFHESAQSSEGLANHLTDMRKPAHQARPDRLEAW